MHHLQSSFEEASGFARYHPSKGYFWDFKSQRANIDKTKKEEKPKEELSSLFQRQRVDMLLGELIKKFPLPILAQSKMLPTSTIKQENGNGSADKSIKTEIKQDKIRPPPEKKLKLN